MSSCPFEDLKARGFIYQNTSEEAIKQLLSEGPVYYYVGFDPTGDSLHVGHLLPVMAMRHLQLAGHKPIVLVGGATGQIGDPSGKSVARVQLSKEVVAHNAECLKKQLSRFISPENAVFANNADWFNDMRYLDFLRDIGSKFSVNKMLTAESVKIKIGSALKRDIEVAVVAKGRNVFSGLPESFEISSGEVYEAIIDTVDVICNAIRQVLNRTDPDLVADITEDGMYLTGGGALLSGMAEKLEKYLGIPVHMLEDPTHSVVKGAAVALKNPGLLKNVDYQMRSIKELAVE